MDVPQRVNRCRAVEGMSRDTGEVQYGVMNSTHDCSARLGLSDCKDPWKLTSMNEI